MTMKKRTAEQKQGEREALSYGLGGVTSTLNSTVKNTYLMTFLTEFAGIDAVFIGIVSTVMSIWDAINDLIIGRIADKTNTRWGKYRPVMLLGILLWTALLIMLFCVPDLSLTGRNIYYVTLLFFVSIGSTCFMIPWQSLNTVMSGDTNVRNHLLMYRSLFGTLAGTLLGVVLVPVVNAVDGGKKGYLTVVVGAAAISLLCGLICFYGVHRKDRPGAIPTPPKTGMREYLKVLANKPVACITGMMACSYLTSALMSGSSMYYFTYVVKNLELVKFNSICSMIAGLLVVPLLPPLYRKIGRTKMFVIGAIIQLTNPICAFIFREHIPVWLMMVTAFTFAAGFSITNTTIMSLVPDCADYTEYRSGYANAGAVSSVVSFSRKFVQSFSTSIIGIALGLSGYIGGMDATPRLVSGILSVKCIVPIVLTCLSVVLLLVFPVRGVFAKEMKQELTRRRAQHEAETASTN